jgi:hypothetical protein
MKQCKKCPWLVGVDPRDIPNGYTREAHCLLESTIAREGVLFDSRGSLGPLRMMACHESPVGMERVCVGWAYNQLGVGNNLRLRLRATRTGEFDNLELRGEQHLTFEATLRDCEK